MNRARLNLLIDAVIGIAFLATAVTGVVFLLPLSWQHALGFGAPGMLGVSLRGWHWLHDWSGVVAATGVLLHFALHYRWVAHTTRRWLGQSPRERAARERVPVRTAPAASSCQADPARGPHDAPLPASAYPPDAGTSRDTRLTRRRFLTGAVGVGAALAAGVVLSKTALSSGSSSTNSSVSGSSSSAASDSSSSAASGSSSSAANSSSDSQSGTTQSGTTQTRVSVDAASCVGCGRCLQTCPASVFAWNGNGRATAKSPGQCTLCRRCVQVCPASAITLNG